MPPTLIRLPSYSLKQRSTPTPEPATFWEFRMERASLRPRRVVSLSAPATKDIGLGTKLAYGVGSIAYGAKVQILGALLFYYNQLEGPAGPLGQLGAGRRRGDRRPLGPHGGPDIRQHPHADRPAPPLHVRLGPAGRPVRGVHAEPAGRPVAHGPADLHGLHGHRLKADDQPLRDPQ